MAICDLVIEASLSVAVRLKEVLQRLESSLAALGFFHDREYSEAGMPISSIRKLYYGGPPGSENGFVDWSESDREFAAGAHFDFALVSRQQFGGRDVGGPFPILLMFTTSANPKPNMVNVLYAYTNLSNSLSDEGWWQEAVDLLKDVVRKIHEELDCERTFLYYKPEDEVVESPEIIFEVTNSSAGGADQL
jgi:hypothetical protein